jgi:RNA polymerase sigma-70 factor (ECF subfamily)
VNGLFRGDRRAKGGDQAAAAEFIRATSGQGWEDAAERHRHQVVPLLDEGVALRRLLVDLEPQRREAFVATQILGLSYQEAADVCDCPVGTIRSRVSRAREDLIVALRADEDPHHTQRAAT